MYKGASTVGVSGANSYKTSPLTVISMYMVCHVFPFVHFITQLTCLVVLSNICLTSAQKLEIKNTGVSRDAVALLVSIHQ